MKRPTFRSLLVRMPNPASTIRVWAILLTLVLASLTGCDDDPLGPEQPGEQPPPVARVAVDPSLAELEVGEELHIDVEVSTADGNILTDRPVTWAATADVAGVVSVDATGLVRALREGTAFVRATAEGKTGEARIVVTPSEPEQPVHVPPTIDALDPASLPAGSPATEVVVRGTGFDETTAAFWNGSGRISTVVGPTELRVSLLAEDLRLSGSGRVWVINQTPVGALESNRMDLAIERAVGSLEITSSVRILFPGERMPFQVRVLDDRGVEMQDVAVQWSAVNGAVVQVDEEGWVGGLTPGETIVIAQAGGREAAKVLRVSQTPSAGLMTATWSPWGSERALSSFELGPESNWSTRVVGGNARQAVASPDGSKILFVTDTADGAADLFVMAWDGSGLRRLTTNPGIDDQPAWSPDGRTIAYRSVRNGFPDIWIMTADGTDLRQVTDFGPIRFGMLGAERPAWSPDGRWIAFAWGDRGFAPARMSLARIRPDGTDMRPVTQPSTFEDSDPSFSPDGTRLVFRRGGNGEDRILVTDLDGNLQLYVYDLGTGRTPRWSPDGRWIVAIRDASVNLAYGAIVLKEIGLDGERLYSSVFDATWMAPR